MSGKLINPTNKCFKEFELETLKAEVLELSFPIGSYYPTQTDINPATILGFGTWERVKGKVLVGLDEDDANFNEIGKEGGESTHTLTEAELPSHKNTYTRTIVTATLNNVDNTLADGSSAVSQVTTGTATTSSVGGDKEHNNLQPYKVIGYMWLRTA